METMIGLCSAAWSIKTCVSIWRLRRSWLQPCRFGSAASESVGVLDEWLARVYQGIGGSATELSCRIT